MEESRVKFAEKSLERASHFNNDPFIKFIILWIGLNSLYGSYEGNEREKVMNYFQKKDKVISKVMSRHFNKLITLENFINNTPQHMNLRKYLRTNRAFLKKDKLYSEDAVKHFANFLYRIRNHMFHAEKSWDEKDEAKLLSKVNPILKEFLSELIESYKI